ncbi:MAG: nuclease A inhibitor family protein [Cyanobacteria bacterium P01_G01_bin.49]
MKPEIEQAYGTLELLIQGLSFYLPGHEDGGYIYPFVWDETTQGKFNIFNLFQSNNWLKITDADPIIKSWKKLEYPRHFNDFSLNNQQIKDWESKIESLWQIITNNLDNLECYNFAFCSSGIIIGQTKDTDWVAITPTIYVETDIPQTRIARSPLNNKTNPESLSTNTSHLDSQLKTITSKLGSISLSGDFGGGYYYSYTHKIVYGIGATKELALENTLQKSQILEISKFNRFYPNDYDNYHENDHQSDRINQFLEKQLTKIILYRISYEIKEYIYIIGQTNSSDRIGLFLKSFFVYNP